MLAGLVAGCTSAPTPRATAPSPAPPPAYLALGDSVAAGVGAASRDRGYVGLLADGLRERLGCAGRSDCLRVHDLAVSGATTATLLRDQLPSAQALLASEPDVRLVTVTVGGNDVFGPVLAACDDPAAAACRAGVADAVAEADRGVDAVLGALAGGGPTVAVMAYYDPLPACRLAPLAPLARLVLEGAPGRPGLNDVLRARAAEHGAVVVETAERLAVPQDLVGGADCLHPSGSGHARIAEAFLDAVGDRVVS